MPLSTRAQRYLTTLVRRPAVPVRDVKAALERAGAPPIASWLDFHERYAGYEDPLGRETAILGIVHTASRWIPAGEASVDREDDGRLSVTCAEVHGAFDYRLYDDGSFSSSGAGGPCESFDVKIEQDAVFVEARSDGRRWQRSFDVTRVPPGGLKRLVAATRARRVEEASDKFGSVWVGADAIWLEGEGEGAPLHLWTVADARERITALLREGG